MTAVHDEILATIERRGLADGVPLAELDAHVADVLGVPPDHYAAWQLVSGALASYADVNILPVTDDLPVGPKCARVKAQLGRIWEQLGAVNDAVAGTDGQPPLRELMGEVFVLTDWLLADDHTLQVEREREGADHG
jgi:hypothetical protein